MSGAKQTVRIEGRSLQLSNLDKVLYPATGTTKRDVIEYYRGISAVMLPHCRDRAATRKRWPNGVGADGSGDFFFQRDLGEHVPDWVEWRSVRHSDHTNRYPLVNDVPTLVWLAQLAALEIHVPQWRFGAGDEHRNPDRLVFDLDPGTGVTLRECADVARIVRKILSGMGLEAVPVTSGSKGIHLYAALDGRQTSDEASSVARELARSLEADYPDEVTSSMKRSLREGKVFIDWSQNNASKTTVAPYSLRGRAHPTVAAPRTWGELASPHLRQLDFREVLERVRRRGDPMAALEGGPQERSGTEDDPGRPRERDEPGRPRGDDPGDRGDPGGRDDPGDRLAVYRSKRNQGRTPEPVPGRRAAPGGTAGRSRTDGSVFVIQRHRARRLHYDFRLEHEGVLVSWALPKGVPVDPRRNHLAVPTEDHPMEYRRFEGTIPEGEYGAGTVEIWDAGEADIEKWRDGEVIATLTGRAGGGLGGPRRFALFRTDGDPKRPQWMIHLMPEPRDRPVPPPEPRDRPVSRSAGARRAGEESRAAQYAPMLATRGNPSELPDLRPEEWAFEMKWDGMRAIVALDGDEIRVRSRSGADVTARYPELAGIGAAVAAESSVLDGEIVALDRKGAPSFARLQQRMGLTGAGEIARARRAVPVSFMVFDVLEVNGRDATSLPYRQRRELLGDMLGSTAGAPLAFPPAFEGDVEDAIAASRELGLEGVVAKSLESPYRSGVRSADWLKFPLIETAEAVVIGWRESAADADGLASLLLATPGDGALRYAGRVGTGFSTRDRRDIRRRLERMERKTAPAEVPAADRRDAHWVTPRLIGEVAYRTRTDDGRFRHATWRGWRPDKGVEDLA